MANCKTRQLIPLNAELNPTCQLLALLGAHHILHVNRIRVLVLKLSPCSKCKLFLFG